MEYHKSTFLSKRKRKYLYCLSDLRKFLGWWQISSATETQPNVGVTFKNWLKNIGELDIYSIKPKTSMNKVSIKNTVFKYRKKFRERNLYLKLHSLQHRRFKSRNNLFSPIILYFSPKLSFSIELFNIVSEQSQINTNDPKRNYKKGIIGF